MFNQIHQRIEIGSKSVRRYYSNPSQLNKIIALKRVLNGLSFVPKVSLGECTKNYYVDEERILGIKLKKTDITAKSVMEIAKLLRQLHNCKLSKSDKNMFSDKFVSDGFYHPNMIFSAAIKQLPGVTRSKYLQYDKLAKRLEDFFVRNKNVQLKIIHADLGLNNILKKKDGKIYFVDWNDARVDLPLVDVYGFFCNFGIKKDLQKAFWKIYGKPEYWSEQLDSFLFMLHKLFMEVPEEISVIIPTYNRCPYESLGLNPLSVTVESLLQNPDKNIIRNIIIADDCSTDYTFETYNYLQRKFKEVTFIYSKNKSRCKASLTRKKAIAACPSQLFIMSDDDCIYPKDMVYNLYMLVKKIREVDKNFCAINIPYVNKKFEFEGTVELSEYGKVDIKNHWLHHNFNRVPIGVKDDFVKVETFDGIYLGVKERFLSVGNYEDLREFVVDYAEHISISWRLLQAGFSLYAAVGKKFLVTHLRFGAHVEGMDEKGFPVKYRGVMTRANRPFLESGDRVIVDQTLESMVSSFIYFYFSLSEPQGYKHMKLELSYLSMDGPVTNAKIAAYKKGATTAIMAGHKRGFIKDTDFYLIALDKIVKKAESDLKIS